MTASADELRIVAEFGMHPVWLVTADGVDNVAPAEVVSAALAARLDAWSERYDAIYDDAYPPASAFASPAAERAFTSEGRDLARAVAREVGSRYGVVRYFDGTGGGYERVDAGT